ncbi:MAG: Gfo/Idh/MocA family oxidoreductase [Planctomycetia bacterium]|nr:Gfo/Idh/MocA family oxidoreductase [Planctomycetia bacterium]
MTTRWGILGCGDIVRKRVARAVQDDPDRRLLAVCRREVTKLEEFRHAFSVERGYARDVDLLADPEIDAVYIATPVRLHLPQTLAAAAAGKHVLVEKPMARTTAECDAMIAACRAHGVRLGVAYYRRFYPLVARLKELLAVGEIGRLLSVSAVTATPLDMAPGEEGYWRVLPEESGGGALMDIGSHRIDLMLDLCGDIADVQAYCDTLTGPHAAEDCASLLFRFRSGMHGTLQCFFGTPAAVDEFTLIGTKGRLSASPLNGSQLVVDLGATQRVETLPPPANLHGPLIADFTAALREGRPPRVTGEAGRAVNAVMERAYRAAQRA